MAKGNAHGHDNKAAAFAAVNPFDGNALYGTNFADSPDVLVGNDADNFFYSFQGADVLTGGAGADTFNFASFWDSSSNGGVDTITDFETGVDKVQLTGLQRYFDTDGDGQNDASRALTADDVTISATGVHASIWDGYDLDINVVGVTIGDIVFA